MNEFIFEHIYKKKEKNTVQIQRKKDIIKPNMIDPCLSVWLRTSGGYFRLRSDQTLNSPSFGRYCSYSVASIVTLKKEKKRNLLGVGSNFAVKTFVNTLFCLTGVDMWLRLGLR